MKKQGNSRGPLKDACNTLENVKLRREPTGAKAGAAEYGQLRALVEPKERQTNERTHGFSVVQRDLPDDGDGHEERDDVAADARHVTIAGHRYTRRRQDTNRIKRARQQVRGLPTVIAEREWVATWIELIDASLYTPPGTPRAGRILREAYVERQHPPPGDPRSGPIAPAASGAPMRPGRPLATHGVAHVHPGLSDAALGRVARLAGCVGIAAARIDTGRASAWRLSGRRPASAARCFAGCLPHVVGRTHVRAAARLAAPTGPT